MIRQRQQRLEHLAFRDIGIEDGRNVFRARGLEQCNFAPASQRGSASTADAASTSSSRSQSACSGNCPRKFTICRSPPASTRIPDTDDWPLSEQPKLADVDALLGKRLAHLAAGGILAATSPKRRAMPPSRATATAAVAAIPPPMVANSTLLIFWLPPEKNRGTRQIWSSAERPRQITRVAPARAVRSAGAVRCLGSIGALPLMAIPAPSSTSNKWILPACGNRDSRSPSFGFSDGSIRAIAERPADIEMNRGCPSRAARPA